MNAFINYLVEANLGLCLFLLLYWILLRRETDFTLKRAFLLISMAVSIAFPFFHVSTDSNIVPTLDTLVPSSWLPEVLVIANRYPITTETHISFDTWLMMRSVYGAGVMITLAVFLAQILRLFRMIQRIPSYTLDRLTILESADDRSAFSFFRFIFIGKAAVLSDQEKMLIIDHERVHAQKLHSFDVLVTKVLGIFFWFNPVIRIYKKIFVHLHEYEADARAVKSHDVNDYCSLLAKVALLSADIRLANHFSNSLTLKRIKMMRTSKAKIKPWKIAALAAAIPLFFFIVACQDQVNGIAEMAGNSSVAVLAPESVVARYEEVKKANPNSIVVLLELNEVADKQLEELDKAHGNPKSIELFTPDKGLYKTSTLNTELEKIVFNQSAEWERASKESDGLRTFAIIEYNDMAKQIAEAAKMNDDVYSIADEPATPENGIPELYELIAHKMIYPELARQKGIEGKVFVEFIVQTDGSITDLKTIKGIGEGCDEAAIIAIKASAAKWIPAKNKGMTVKQRLVLPVTFALTNSATSDNFVNEVVDEVEYH